MNLKKMVNNYQNHKILILWKWWSISVLGAHQLLYNQTKDLEYFLYRIFWHICITFLGYIARNKPPLPKVNTPQDGLGTSPKFYTDSMGFDQIWYSFKTGVQDVFEVETASAVAPNFFIYLCWWNVCPKINLWFTILFIIIIFINY